MYTYAFVYSMAYNVCLQNTVKAHRYFLYTVVLVAWGFIKDFQDKEEI